MITDADRAWAAGLLDAMGNFQFRELETGTLNPMVSISTAKFEVVEPLAAMTGVALITVRRNYKRSGCGEHCTEAHLHIDSTTARWSLTGARSTVFLSGVLPFLKVQAGEAEKAIHVGLEANPKPATLQKMYDLGWPKVKFGESS